MKFIVSATALRCALKPLVKVVNSSTVLPILEDVLLTLSPGTLTLTTTDLENTMSTTIDIETKESGWFCLPAKKLFNLLGKCPDQPLVFMYKADAKKCTITGDIFSLGLHAEAGENYPKSPDGTQAQKGTVAVAPFLKLLKKASLFTSDDELRPAMTAIYLHDYEDKLWIVATDAHRLFFDALPLPKELTGLKALLPLKAALVLLNAAPQYDLEIGVDNDYWFISCGRLSLSSRIVDAKYPDYRAILKEVPYEFQLVRKDAKYFLSLAQYFTNGHTRTLELQLSVSKQALVAVAADIDDDQEMKALLPVYNITGASDYLIGINDRFLQQAISLNPDPYVRIQHNGTPHSYILIDNNILIMPLMLNK